MVAKKNLQQYVVYVFFGISLIAFLVALIFSYLIFNDYNLLNSDTNILYYMGYLDTNLSANVDHYSGNLKFEQKN